VSAPAKITELLTVKREWSTAKAWLYHEMTKP
jgi:hypothetical protein